MAEFNSILRRKHTKLYSKRRSNSNKKKKIDALNISAKKQI
jgi:hypothetical protein